MSAGRLVPIDRKNWRVALEVRVADDQLRFVADHQPIALVILAKSYVGAGGWEWEPLAYETGTVTATEAGEVVGVLGLAYGSAGAQLVNLAIDHRHQRSGLGAAAMMAVIERVRVRPRRFLSLAVHPDNHAAQGLYRKVGFTPTGELQGGEPVWAIDL